MRLIWRMPKDLKLPPVTAGDRRQDRERRDARMILRLAADLKARIGNAIRNTPDRPRIALPREKAGDEQTGL
jgi:hypothetical protein